MQRVAPLLPLVLSVLSGAVWAHFLPRRYHKHRTCCLWSDWPLIFVLHLFNSDATGRRYQLRGGLERLLGHIGDQNFILIASGRFDNSGWNVQVRLSIILVVPDDHGRLLNLLPGHCHRMLHWDLCV